MALGGLLSGMLSTAYAGGSRSCASGVDDLATTPADVEAMTAPDETAGLNERQDYEIY